MPFEIGTAVKIRSTGQNGRVISLNDDHVNVRLSLDKDNPSADWISTLPEDVEELEAPDESS
jgi:hypothetical protein